MISRQARFGAELRQRRLARGWSLEALAGEVHFSKSYLSRVENGDKPGSADLAKLCDLALAAGGALINRFAEQNPTAAPRSVTAVMPEPEPGGDRVEIDVDGLAAAEILFAELRAQGRRLDARLIVPCLLAHTRTLICARPVGGGPVVRNHLRLSARYAEFAGWMLQETGARPAALHWTDVAVDLAREAGDQTMEPHALVRRALFALYRGDPRQTVELAAMATGASGATPSIRAWALQREAQGHALAGRADLAETALLRAAEVAVRGAGENAALGLGPTVTGDPLALTRAWCAYELGRPADAAELFETALADIPPDFKRSRARYRTRAALAYASSGDVPAACAAVRLALPDIMSVRSATIAPDLRRLNRTLGRWRRSDEVLSVQPGLSDALAVAP